MSLKFHISFNFRSSSAWLLGVWGLSNHSTLQWRSHLDIISLSFDCVPSAGNSCA